MKTQRLKIATGTGAIAISHQERVPFYIYEVRLTLAAAATDLADFSIKVDSELGATYDHELAAPDPDADLSAVTSFRYADMVPPVFFPNDKLDISWPNAGSVTWTVEVIGFK